MNRFANNSRVCFVGDSITHGNVYLMHIVSHYKKNFPDSNINFYNCGISGAILDEHLKILEKDTLSYNPTHIVMMIGINDSGRENLSDCRSAERYQKLKFAFEKYKKNLSEICDIFKSKGIEIVLCTCVPYDEYGDYCTAPLRGGMPLIMSYNEYIRNFARENGFELCDYFTYMIEKMQTECLFDADSVHPNDRGHYYMAKCFLENQGLKLESDAFSEKLTEWNECVNKLRDIWACESLVIGDFSLEYDDGFKKMTAFLETDNDDDCSLYLRGLAEKYQINKPFQSDIKSRIIEIMENEL